jgi:[ribosomal protein S5]-alanine N-acetyltransferase
MMARLHTMEYGKFVRTEIIRTPRMILRTLKTEDSEPLHALLTQPGVRRFLCDGRELSREEVDEIQRTSAMLYEMAGTGLWRMSESGADEKIIGVVGFMRFHEPPVSELIFAVDEGCWGRGMAVEAGRAMLGYARDTLGWVVAQASTDLENKASVRTLRSLGFTEVYTMHGPVAPLRIYRRAL